MKDSNGGTYGRALQMGAALLALVLLSACFDKTIIGGPTQVVGIDDHSGQVQPSPAPGGACLADGLDLGTVGDDFTLTADGTDSVTLVVGYFRGIARLTGSEIGNCTASFTSTGPCVVSGTTVTSASAGVCSVTAGLGGLRSNALGLTAIP